MKNSINFLIIYTILFIFSIGMYTSGSYALEKNNLELLILNYKYQKELKNEIDNINKYEEELKTRESNINNKQNIIKLTFSKKDLNLKQYKQKLLNDLEEIKIEEVRMKKVIEQERQKELQQKQIEFTEGCWPIKDYKEVSSPFGYRVHPITGEVKFHKGIDIPAPENTDILSSDDGVVMFSDIQTGYGNVVKIKHFDGKETVYAHNLVNLVKEGDIVRQGELIAKVGSTGDSTGNHVHFEIIVNEKNINPISGVENLEF